MKAIWVDEDKVDCWKTRGPEKEGEEWKEKDNGSSSAKILSVIMKEVSLLFELSM